MEESAVLKRENELRKRNDDIRSKKLGSSSETLNLKAASTEKLESVITESEVNRRSSNAVKKFEKEL